LKTDRRKQASDRPSREKPRTPEGFLMRTAFALAAVLAAGAPLAAAADPPPLRSLVFDVSYSAHSTHEKRTSGFNGAYGGGLMNGAGGPPSGSATAAVGLDGSDSGKMTLDVIAATKDGGLVVDAAYTGKLGGQPKLRIVVFPDGRLSADPTKSIDPAVVQVLPLLARGFIANRDVAPGSSWVMPAPPPLKGSTTYRVTALDGQYATLALEGSRTMGGVNGFDETDRGTAKYATDLIVPVSYDVSSHIRREPAMDETVTTDARLVVTLVSDSFAKK
jgi:hypothetical protein